MGWSRPGSSTASPATATRRCTPLSLGGGQLLLVSVVGGDRPLLVEDGFGSGHDEPGGGGWRLVGAVGDLVGDGVVGGVAEGGEDGYAATGDAVGDGGAVPGG